jgi:hypothetical protein
VESAIVEEEEDEEDEEEERLYLPSGIRQWHDMFF